jgi:hypothetical protein
MSLKDNFINSKFSIVLMIIFNLCYNNHKLTFN